MKKKRNGEATYGGALRAPLAGSPACVFVFVFVLIYVEFEFSESTRRPPARKTNQRADPLCEKIEKSKCVSNDRSHHDDQNEYRIIKNGAILKG